MIKPCECESPGWCERHQCNKTPHLHQLCQTRADYRSLWDRLTDDRGSAFPVGDGSAETFPPIREQFRTYTAALRRWWKAGRPRRPKEEVARIVAICRGCEFYTDGRCRLCGCPCNESRNVLRNKAKMATEECPLEEPKWTAWTPPTK